MAKKKIKYAWDASRIQALRRHLGLTQQQLADELGTRQQTISEWEREQYQPRGTSSRLLTLVAERAAFSYEVVKKEGPARRSRKPKGREGG
ncbi:MAG: helix-turn-helix domain-containing protein [Dehalococcoidia bacterium]|jgi:DNA-binding transcriptional regulator YiaG|nr:helix-turn-helix domain-containing protein [Dehalococcoidia bacterium]